MKVFKRGSHIGNVQLAQALRPNLALAAGETSCESSAPLDFVSIYDQHFNNVLRWLRALGGIESDLEDLAQEVFVVVRRKLSSFDGANLQGWLYKISKLTVRDHARRAWFRHIFRGRQEVDFDKMPSLSTDPETTLAEREDRQLFYKLVGQMSARRRETLLLYEVEGYSGEEIAQLHNVPINTVWTRLHHARKELIAKARELLPERAGRP